MRRAGDLALLLVGLLAAWLALAALAGPDAIAGPGETFRHLQAMAARPDFSRHLAETGAAFLQALAYAGLGGLAVGLWLGFHRLSGEVAEPILVALYSLPKVTLYPVVLLIFGLGMPAKVAFGAIHGIIPVAIFAMNAVRNIDPTLLRTARALRLDLRQTVATVLVPAALPEIVSGLRIGFSLTLLGVLIGEMFASRRGLGFLVINAVGLNDTKTIMAVAVMLFTFAAIANALLLALDRRLHRRSEAA
jgi:NitT/TauT family transport system permease protein